MLLQNKMGMDPELMRSAQSGKRAPQKFYDARDRLSKIMNDIMGQRRAELREKGIDYDPRADTGNARDAASKYESKVDGEDLYESMKDLEFESYLDYLSKLVDEGKITNEVAEVDTLLLFSAGFQNVAMSFKFALNDFAKCPDVQNKVRAELFAAHGINNDYKKGDGMIEFDLRLITKCPLFRASWFVRLTPGRTSVIDIPIEWKGNNHVIP